MKNDEVISTGYNGAPRGRANCTDLGRCIREEMKIPRGERYELCRSVHAEQNAVISASRGELLGSSMYMVGVEASDGSYVANSSSCPMCKRVLINAGIKDIFVRDTKNEYRHILIEDWIANDDSLSGTFGY